MLVGLHEDKNKLFLAPNMAKVELNSYLNLRIVEHDF